MNDTLKAALIISKSVQTNVEMESYKVANRQSEIYNQNPYYSDYEFQVLLERHTKAIEEIKNGV